MERERECVCVRERERERIWLRQETAGWVQREPKARRVMVQLESEPF